MAAGLGPTGCWPQPGGNAGRQNYNGLETTLTVDTVACTPPGRSTSAAPSETVLVAAGHLFVGQANGQTTVFAPSG